MFNIRNQTPADHIGIEHLLDLAFGADRANKSAYSLRQGLQSVPELFMAAEKDGGLVGSIQFWPLEVGRSLCLSSGQVSGQGVLLLGPLAVHPDLQGLGIGKALIEEGLSRAKGLGFSAAVLVGDPAYYQKFGFSHDCVRDLKLPAEPDQMRVQGRELTNGALSMLTGEIVALTEYDAAI